MLTHCPNCGAIITGSTCEYCGTRFSKESNIAILYANDAEIFRVIRDQAKKYRIRKGASELFEPKAERRINGRVERG